MPGKDNHCPHARPGQITVVVPYLRWPFKNLKASSIVFEGGHRTKNFLPAHGAITEQTESSVVVSCLSSVRSSSLRRLLVTISELGGILPAVREKPAFICVSFVMGYRCECFLTQVMGAFHSVVDRLH